MMWAFSFTHHASRITLFVNHDRIFDAAKHRAGSAAGRPPGNLPLWLQEGLDRKLTQPIFDAAKARNVPIKTAPKQQLGQMAQDSSHQGVLLEVGEYRYSDVDEILALAALQNEKPFILLLDLLHGPQNIGALLRTAEICGVHGVILQDRRAPDITTAVSGFSVGATEHLLIAQVTNLVQTIRRLQGGACG
jgi:23S rRNA (guanosine2251-2'-O)-methyltransferase